jgi:hypothetical protein
MRMGHGFRSALRLAATVAAAAAVARAAESARRVLEQMALDPPRHRAFPLAAPEAFPDPPTPFVATPLVAPAPVAGFIPDLTVTANRDEITTPPIPHAFGPAPSIAPSRGIGFHTTISAPPTDTTDVIELEASGELDDEDGGPAEKVDEMSPLDTLLARRHASDEAPVAELDDRPARVSARDAPAPARPLPGQHRRVKGAVSGTVSNVYGRGIRGLRVEVVDEDKAVVASATTGVNGRFVVEEVPAGTYRVRALDDIDDDFETSWHGGSRFRKADDITVRADGTRRGVDVVLRSKAQIDVDATVTRRSADIEVRVTHRATGAPAAGTVQLSTRDIVVVIPLVDGRASITLGGRSAGIERSIGRTLRVDYLGDSQTRPSSVKVRLS